MPGNPLSDELLDGMHTLAEMTSDVHVSVTKDAFLAMSTELIERRKADAVLGKFAIDTATIAELAMLEARLLDVGISFERFGELCAPLTPNKDTTS